MSQQVKGKIPVLIASTLKPVRDVRAYHKLAQSLGETNKYRLFIIGFSPKKPKKDNEIRFFSSMSHFNSALDRMAAQVRFAWRMIQIKPKLLIACTFEFLPLASIFQRLWDLKIVYDVQENYLANLELNIGQSNWKRKIAKRLIQWSEASANVSLHLFAEKCYAEEMPNKIPFQILENKYQGVKKVIPPKTLSSKQAFSFSITGTLTPAYGILEAIDWFISILEDFPESSLTIIGHVTLPEFESQLNQKIKGIPQIQTKLSTEPIPHEELLEAITSSDFSLLPYQNHPAIKSKIPTKLFECAALGVPVLMTPNPNWEQFYNSYQGGFTIDFSDLKNSKTQFAKAIAQTYFSTSVLKTIFWDSQKADFLREIERILA